jgi:two-component system, chemotaxis family, chemotaxis protein CheY
MFPADTRFLVVDDFKTMRSIVKKTLQNMGYTNLEEAEDGAKAYQAMNQAFTQGKPFGCIVCDWNMPNLSGLELLRKVRSDANFKTLPFVLVTAENEQKQVIEAAKAGVSNYIVKPFTPNDFQAKMKLVYSKHFPAKVA